MRIKNYNILMTYEELQFLKTGYLIIPREFGKTSFINNLLIKYACRKRLKASRRKIRRKS